MCALKWRVRAEMSLERGERLRPAAPGATRALTFTLTD
jgi:hypothetical protein